MQGVREELLESFQMASKSGECEIIDIFIEKKSTELCSCRALILNAALSRKKLMDF